MSEVDAKDVRLPWPSNYGGALNYAIGKELQFLGGVPSTVVRADFFPGETELKVISTFGYPRKGKLAAGRYVFTYTGKTDASFTGVAGLRPLAVPRGAAVRLITRDILPPVYNKTPGLEYTPAVEKYYLQLNGTDDFGHVPDGLLGYSDQYALVVKLARKPAATLSYPYVAQAYLRSETVDFRYLCDIAYVNGDLNAYRIYGLKHTDGGTNYERNSSSDTVTIGTGRHLYMLGRDLSANVAKARVLVNGALIWSPADQATVVDSAPDSIAVGARVKGSSATGAYSDLRVIAVVALHKIPTNDELRAYDAPGCRDALEVWPDAPGYWVSGQIANFSGTWKSPNLGSGAVPMTWVGPTSADLAVI